MSEKPAIGTIIFAVISIVLGILLVMEFFSIHELRTELSNQGKELRLSPNQPKTITTFQLALIFTGMLFVYVALMLIHAFFCDCGKYYEVCHSWQKKEKTTMTTQEVFVGGKK